MSNNPFNFPAACSICICICHSKWWFLYTSNTYVCLWIIVNVDQIVVSLNVRNPIESTPLMLYRCYYFVHKNCFVLNFKSFFLTLVSTCLYSNLCTSFGGYVSFIFYLKRETLWYFDWFYVSTRFFAAIKIDYIKIKRLSKWTGCTPQANNATIDERSFSATKRWCFFWYKLFQWASSFWEIECVVSMCVVGACVCVWVCGKQQQKMWKNLLFLFCSLFFLVFK